MVDYDGIAEKVNAALAEARNVNDRAYREATNAYDTACNASRAAFAEESRPLRETYDVEIAKIRKVQTDADDAATTAYNEAIKAAEETYAKAGVKAAEEAIGDADLPEGAAKALAWMIKDGVWRSYHSYCLIVLRNLPLDLKGLLDLQEQNNWCSEFNDILERALKANAIDGVTAQEAAEHRFVTWMKRNISRGSTQSELRAILDDVVAATRAEVALEKADA